VYRVILLRGFSIKLLSAAIASTLLNGRILKSFFNARVIQINNSRLYKLFNELPPGYFQNLYREYPDFQVLFLLQVYQQDIQLQIPYFRSSTLLQCGLVQFQFHLQKQFLV